MIRALIIGLALFFAAMLGLLGLAIAQSYAARIMGAPLGDVIFFTVFAGAVLLVILASRKFSER
jgi:hypothetical protein